MREYKHRGHRNRPLGVKAHPERRCSLAGRPPAAPARPHTAPHPLAPVLAAPAAPAPQTVGHGWGWARSAQCRA